MNSKILEVSIYDLWEHLICRNTMYKKVTLGSFKIFGIIKISYIGIHFMNIENLS